MMNGTGPFEGAGYRSDLLFGFEPDYRDAKAGSRARPFSRIALDSYRGGGFIDHHASFRTRETPAAGRIERTTTAHNPGQGLDFNIDMDGRNHGTPQKEFCEAGNLDISLSCG